VVAASAAADDWLRRKHFFHFQKQLFSLRPPFRERAATSDFWVVSLYIVCRSGRWVDSIKTFDGSN
jgi:hypothetical protein